MIFISTVAAIAATTTGVYFSSYTRRGEELSKYAPWVGSKPAKPHQKGGWKWTPAGKLAELFKPDESVAKDKEKEDKDLLDKIASSAVTSLASTIKAQKKADSSRRTIFVDEFRYFPETIKKCSPFFIGREKMESTRLYWSPIDMTRSILVIGPMGSGKTEMLYNLVFSDWYKRLLVRDAKGADFSPVLVDGKRAWVMNMYNDKMAAIWDIMEEANFLLMIAPVAMDLMVGAVGESDNPFFASSAADRVKNMFETAYLQGTDSKSRWTKLEEEIVAYEKRATAPKSTENKDVYNNFLLVAETLKFWAWRAQNAKKTFTISGFLKSEWQLVMNGSEQTMKSYYSAFVSALVDEMLRMPDSKEDFTFLLLDEYLTMPLSEPTRLKLHTMIRSKGGCLCAGMQFLPGDNVKVQQILDSSKFATILFNLQDGHSSDHFKKFYGEIKYKEQEKSYSKNKNDYTTSVSTSEQERSSSFLTEEELQRKPPFHHLTILQTGQAYLGYTPQVNAPKIYNPLADIIDITDFKARMQKIVMNKSE